MSERARNLAVGLTVLVALGMLATMVMLFTVAPATLQRGYVIRIEADSTLDVQEGFPIHFAGIPVGHITEIKFTDPHDPTHGVTMIGRIDQDIRLPGNTNVYIFTKGFVGSAWVELKSNGPAHVDPATGKPLDFLPRDGSVPLRAIHEGSSLIPDELKTALEDIRGGFKQLGTLAANLNDLIAPQSQPATAAGEPTTAAASGPATAPAPGARGLLDKLNKALDGINVMVGDTDNQQNLKTALANLAKASGQASEVMGDLKIFIGEANRTLAGAGKDIDQLTGKLMDGADKLATLMTSLNQVASKLQTNEGTAGKLLNDPKLYNNLLEITNQMTILLKDLRVLVNTWQKSGVGIKLK